jgi:alkylhydroperoxidase family enzyme
LRPEIYAAWVQLNGSIKATMDPRRYELATLAGARRLRSTYCSMAHGWLIESFMEPDQLIAIMADHHVAGPDTVEVAVMDLADKVATDAARCFFSKALDGLGVQADAKYAALEPRLRAALTVGRPIENG